MRIFSLEFNGTLFALNSTPYRVYVARTYKSASTLKQFSGGNTSRRDLNTISEFSLLLGSTVHSNSSPRDRSC